MVLSSDLIDDIWTVYTVYRLYDLDIVFVQFVIILLRLLITLLHDGGAHTLTCLNELIRQTWMVMGKTTKWLSNLINWPEIDSQFESYNISSQMIVDRRLEYNTTVSLQNFSWHILELVLYMLHLSMAFVMFIDCLSVVGLHGQYLKSVQSQYYHSSWSCIIWYTFTIMVHLIRATLLRYFKLNLTTNFVTNQSHSANEMPCS